MNSMELKKLLIAGFMTCLCACNCVGEKPENPDDQQGTVTPPVEETYDVTVYKTSADKSYLFARSGFDFSKPGSMSPNQIIYDKTRTQQEIDGFGLAVTTASCYNLLQMSQEDRTAFLTELFSKDNIGSSLIRVAIGASDFCVGDNYTWCDKEGMQNFAVHSQDKELLFPILKEIYAINPDVKIIGSPWSCPKWMKGSYKYYDGYDESVLESNFDSWTSGRLRPSCYDDYAEYFVKWIQTMEAEGFDVYAVTMQNEPLNHGNSMSMYMPWKDQLKFIKVLGPAIQAAGLDTKIMLYDHNYNYDGKTDQDNYPLNIYADPEASKWAAGSAWHNYGGSVTELNEIYKTYPDKGIWFTEASIGEWNYDLDGQVGGKFNPFVLDEYSNVFMGTMSRGGRGVTYWNLMLDQNKGPYSPHAGSCKTCYGGVTINSTNYKSITRNAHWYHVAHASAVVKPGARKLDVNTSDFHSNFECQMFLNPDNTIGVLICNRQDKDQALVFANTQFTVKYNVPAKSLVSLIWQE